MGIFLTMLYNLQHSQCHRLTGKSRREALICHRLTGMIDRLTGGGSRCEADVKHLYTLPIISNLQASRICVWIFVPQ